MPIYCYKCETCGCQREEFARSYDSVTAVRCPECTKVMPRDFGSELPRMNTRNGEGVGQHGTARVYDQGAGRSFEYGTQGEDYRRWAKANTKNGVTPEPLTQGEIEESVHQTFKPKKLVSPMSDKEHAAAWNEAHHEAKKEQQQAERIVVS